MFKKFFIIIVILFKISASVRDCITSEDITKFNDYSQIAYKERVGEKYYCVYYKLDDCYKSFQYPFNGKEEDSAAAKKRLYALHHRYHKNNYPIAHKNPWK